MLKNSRNLLSWLRNSAIGLYPIHAKLDQLKDKVDAIAQPAPTAVGEQPDELLVGDAEEASLGMGETPEPTEDSVAPVPQPEIASPEQLPAEVETRPTIALLPAEALRMVFVIQHPSIWPSWRSIWKAAQDDPRFDVKVVLAPFLHPFSSTTAIDYDDTRALLLHEQVPFLHADFFDPGIYRPHVAFIQNPYEETRPESLRTEALQRSGIRVAYVPYGLEMGGGAWNFKAQFDSQLHRTAWKIFSRSERNKRMFGKYCSSGNNHVVVTGHPKLDALKGSTALPDQKQLEKIANRKVVLWTPHFSVSEQPTWSSYKNYAGAIFSRFRECDDVFLLIRPHPLFVRAMHQHGVWDAQGEQNFRREIEESGNMALDENADYAASFKVADALMADVGSFLLEFLPTGKPILYLHCAGGLGMNDDGDMVNSTYAAFDESDIFNFVDMIAHGQDPLKSKRASIVDDFLFGLGLDSTAGERICQYVHTSIAKGDSWSSPNSERINTSAAATPEESAFSDDYTEKLDTALDEAMKLLPEIDNALDIDCGDGRFTLRLAKHARRITGYDGSWVLLEKARLAASETSSEKNVIFSQQEVDVLAALEKFDLTACVNVLSSIGNDAKLLHILDRLMMLSRHRGHLMLIDTFLVGAKLCAPQADGQLGKYRSIEDYSALLRRRGFHLAHEFLIDDMEARGLAAKLLLFEFADPLLPSCAKAKSSQPSNW